MDHPNLFLLHKPHLPPCQSFHQANCAEFVPKTVYLFSVQQRIRLVLDIFTQIVRVRFMQFNISPSIGVKSIIRCIVESLMALLICFAPAAFLVAADDEEVPVLSVHQVKKMLHNSDVIIIDVRRHRNWWRSTQKILTSVRENPSEVEQWALNYPKDKSLVFY